VRFGLLLYPGTSLDCSMGMTCDAGMVVVEPAENTLEGIDDALASATTCSLGTPTAEALAGVAAGDVLRSSQRPSVIVLITDGMSSCEPPAPAAASLVERSPSVISYVIGFGDAVDAVELTAIAESGGTASSNPGQGYFHAQDGSELLVALSLATQGALPCSFDLAEWPKPHGSEALLYFGEELVERDEAHQQGWDYDGSTNRVTVYGQSCEMLASKQVTEASLVYTCSFEPL
jgi:hypothetical protein